MPQSRTNRASSRSSNYNRSKAARLGRAAFLVFVAVALFVMGRNAYRRHLNAALGVAVDKGRLADARSLLDRGAEVDAPQNTTPLLWLALTRIASVPAAAPGGLQSAPSNYPDAEAIACLLIAKQADLRLPRFLYRNGQQTITAYEADGYIKEACRLGSLPVLRCLLDKGVVPNSDCIEAALQFQNELYQGGGLSDLTETDRSGKVNAAAVAENIRRRNRRKEIIGQMAQMLREHGAVPTLAQCVTLGDIAAIKTKLDAASPQAAANMASSLLPSAVGMDNRALVNLLLEHGADVNYYSQNSSAALGVAVQNGNLEMVNLLLARGAKVNVKGVPLLQPALYSKRPEIARLLLARGADPNQHSDRYSGSILEIAIYNMPQVIPDILRHDANVRADNGASLRAVLNSSRLSKSQRMMLIKELLQRGANVNPPIVSERTALAISASGVVLPPQQPMVVSSPLLVAACCAPECMDILRRAGAKIGTEKRTILATAAKAGRADLFTRLLDLGADINGKDENGETALTQAIMHVPAGVPFLIERGANVNIIPRSQHTPLMVAVTAGNVGIARLLLAHGADVNLRGERGHTPLYLAQKHRPPEPEMVTLLEQAGAKAD